MFFFFFFCFNPRTPSGVRQQGGDCLKHFAIAGADKQFVWANAVIVGNKVVV